MLQRFIDNTFYLLLLFTLVFGVIFYDSTKYFSFIDELCAIALCGLYLYYVLHTPNWSVNKLFLATLGVFSFYLVYSFAIHCNTKAAIISDFIIQIKPSLAFFTVYACPEYTLATDFSTFFYEGCHLSNFSIIPCSFVIL